MVNHLSAFEVLQLCLAVGFIAALFGWLGGVGGTLLLRFDVARTKSLVTTLSMSERGVKGQAVVAANREKLSRADREAESLKAALDAAAQARPRGPRSLKQAIAAEGLPDDEAFAAEVGR